MPGGLASARPRAGLPGGTGKANAWRLRVGQTSGRAPRRDGEVNAWRALWLLCHDRGVFSTQDQAALAAELETRLASFIDENRLPGGAAGVVCVVLLNGAIDSAAITMDLAALARKRTPPRPPPITLPAPAPENYQPLLGIYAPPDVGSWLIRLEWTRGQLVFTLVESPGWRIVLAPTPDPDLFTIADGGDLPGGSVTFHRFADGRVASVLLLDSTWVRLDQATP